MSRQTRTPKEEHRKFIFKTDCLTRNLHEKMLKCQNLYTDDCAYPVKTLWNKGFQSDALDARPRGTIGRGNRTAKHAGRQYLRHLEIQTRAKGGLMKR